MFRQHQIQRKTRSHKASDPGPDASWSQPRYEPGQDEVAEHVEEVLVQEGYDDAASST